MNSLTTVKVSLTHEDCWTSQLNFVDTFTVNYFVYPERGYLRSTISVPKELRVEVMKMKNSEGVKSVLHVHDMGQRLLVDFINRYKDSIAGFLYDQQVLFLKNTIENGVENWEFVTPRSKAREIIKGLESFGDVRKVIKSDNSINFLPELSDAQIKALVYAFKYGYLNYPRNVKAEEVARKMGISKITFLYHLRSSEKRLIEFFLRSSYPAFSEDDN
ncbi:bacterio-opsin activator [Candidatus Acidianus copahuensis]|uniref:Bacterio-opsin activator n=1 Tax=Candidatus Acidianus copahuensis TaxID=1160895 RepID=A0A031LQ23_9CREN|nr:helix-turn-helix domain-containing protein [Candidatus Acidianus copahuensis]EZQ04923.1 bacterio-opsin activator [Candidatus Acidianus copahuensis]